MGHGWQWQCGDHGTSADVFRSFCGDTGRIGPHDLDKWVNNHGDRFRPQFMGFWDPGPLNGREFMAEIKNGGFLRSLRIYNTIRSQASK